MAEMELTDLEKVLPAEIRLDLPQQTITWEQYEEYLELNGVMDVQLEIVNTLKRDLKKYPARTSRLESIQYFPWIKAGNRFRGTAFEPCQGGSCLCTVKIDFSCGQAILDALVKSLYSKTLSLDVDNCIEILLLADYLQADWVTTNVYRHMEETLLPKDPLAVFRLGQSLPNSNLSKSAVRLMTKGDLAGMRRLIASIGAEDYSLQEYFITESDEWYSLRQPCALVRIARLKVLELILENAEKQGWKLRQRHLEALEKTFAESQDITTCLDTKSDSLTEVDEMRIQLAIMLLSQRERVADLTYTQRMEWEVFEKDMQDDKDLESPLLQDFHITVKVYEGAWGLFVKPRPRRRWGQQNKARIYCRDPLGGRSTFFYIDPKEYCLIGRQTVLLGPSGDFSQFFRDKKLLMRESGPVSLTVVLEMTSAQASRVPAA